MRFDEDYVTKQLRACGVVETIKICQSAMHTRFRFDRSFVSRRFRDKISVSECSMKTSCVAIGSCYAMTSLKRSTRHKSLC